MKSTIYKLNSDRGKYQDAAHKSTMNLNSINNEIFNQKNKMTQLNNQKKEIAGKIDTVQLCKHFFIHNNNN